MSGSNTNGVSREEVLAAVRRIPSEQDHVWDGQNDDDRPATEEEMRAGIAAYRCRVGGDANASDAITLPLDREVLEAFRATGPGWQSRINTVLKEWIAAHPVR